MLVGLVSDTHGVYDPALAAHFAGADAILHAGDVGSHGGHAAVLARLRELCPAVHCVRGNVDDDAAALQDLPDSLLLTLAGWRVLLVHILADAAAAVQRYQPDIVLHGHSHQYSVEEVEAPQGGVMLRVNPGSAGPARFKLKRTAALLTLPPKGAPMCRVVETFAAQLRMCDAFCAYSQPLLSPTVLAADSGERPQVQRIELAAKAPPRLPEACKPKKQAASAAAGSWRPGGAIGSRQRQRSRTATAAGAQKRLRV